MFSVLFSYKKYIRIDTETKIGINNIISICSVNVTVFVKIFIKIIIVHTIFVYTEHHIYNTNAT